MTFIYNDEAILLMDMTLERDSVMTLDELKQFRDAGVKTVLWLGPTWDEWARTPDFKNLDWSQFDDYRERLNKVGLKALVMCWLHGSRRYTADYYVKRFARYEFGVFSPWNPRAVDVYNRSLELVIDYMTSDTIQIMSGYSDGNERVLLNVPAYHDEYALRDWQRLHSGHPDHRTPEGADWLRMSYLRTLLNQQRIMVDTQHREIWYGLSRYKPLDPKVECSGCEWIDDYLESWQGLSPANIHHLNYNYFPYDLRVFAPIIKAEAKRWGVHEWVGAEYCEGLRDGNGRKAIKAGYRIILAPLHFYTRHKRVRPWMVDEVRKHVELYRSGLNE